MTEIMPEDELWDVLEQELNDVLEPAQKRNRRNYQQRLARIRSQRPLERRLAGCALCGDPVTRGRNHCHAHSWAEG